MAGSSSVDEEVPTASWAASAWTLSGADLTMAMAASCLAVTARLCWASGLAPQVPDELFDFLSFLSVICSGMYGLPHGAPSYDLPDLVYNTEQVKQLQSSCWIAWSS